MKKLLFFLPLLALPVYGIPTLGGPTLSGIGGTNGGGSGSGGVYVAQGTNTVLTTNGTVVTINAVPGGGGGLISNYYGATWSFATRYTNGTTYAAKVQFQFLLTGGAPTTSGLNVSIDYDASGSDDFIRYFGESGLATSSDVADFIVPPGGVWHAEDASTGGGSASITSGRGGINYFTTNSTGSGSASLTAAVTNQWKIDATNAALTVVANPTNPIVRGSITVTNAGQDQYRGVFITNGILNIPAFNDDYNSALGWTGIRFYNTNGQTAGYIWNYAQHGGVNRPEVGILSAEDIAIVPGDNHVKGSGNLHLGSSADDHDTTTIQHDDALTYGWHDGITAGLTFGHSKIFRFYTRATNGAIAYPSIVAFGATTNASYAGGDYDGNLAPGELWGYAVPPSYKASTEYSNNQGLVVFKMHTNSFEIVGDGGLWGVGCGTNTPPNLTQTNYLSWKVVQWGSSPPTACNPDAGSPATSSEIGYYSAASSAKYCVFPVNPNVTNLTITMALETANTSAAGVYWLEDFRSCYVSPQVGRVIYAQSNSVPVIVSNVAGVKQVLATRTIVFPATNCAKYVFYYPNAQATNADNRAWVNDIKLVQQLSQ